MRRIGDRRLRRRRTPRHVAEYVGAATWQQRATLSVALAGGLTCAYLVVHLLGIEIRVPGLAAPARTPAFVSSPAPARPEIALPSPSERPVARAVARAPRRRPIHVIRARPAAAPPAAVEASAPPPPAAAPTPPPVQPRPAPTDTGASAEPPPAVAAIVPIAPPPPPPPVSPPALSPLPELPLPVPSVEPPALPVPLPTIP
jgi:hypothetical protein